METTLITGASAGIGRALALVCARRGHNLILVARSEDRLRDLAAEIERRYSATVREIPGDLTDAQFRSDLMDRIRLETGVPDNLINNAGFGDYGDFHESDWERDAAMIELNVTALTHLTHMALGPMVDRGHGRIMNVASTGAFQPGPLMAVYYATKAYVLHFTEGVADEVRHTGVTLTALCPGPTQSEFAERAGSEKSRMFQGRTVPDAMDVARYGYDAMIDGKTVAVHGLVNRVLAASVGFMPRAIVPRVVRFMTRETR